MLQIVASYILWFSVVLFIGEKVISFPSTKYFKYIFSRIVPDTYSFRICQLLLNTIKIFRYTNMKIDFLLVCIVLFH